MSPNQISSTFENWINKEEEDEEKKLQYLISDASNLHYFSASKLLTGNPPTSSGIVISRVEYTVRQTIRTLRESSGLTWEQLAKIFGVTRRALHLWDTGSRMTPANQEKLGRVINAVQSFDTGDVSENRRLLLTPIAGNLPIDLLKDNKFDDFSKLKYDFIARIHKPSLSEAEMLARSPLPPEILTNAKHDRIHNEKRKKRSMKIKRKI